MSKQRTEAVKTQAKPSADGTSSRRHTQNDAERAVEHLVAHAAKFQTKLGDLIRGRTSFKLRLEVSGDRGRVTDIDINEFTRVKPDDLPPPTMTD